MRSALIQVSCSPPGRGSAQARMTASKAVSLRMVNLPLRATRRRERRTRKPSRGKTPRGSGLNHWICPVSGSAMGKAPWM